VDERRVIRRKPFTLSPCTVDEAAVEMDLLDYDFHLFTEKATGAASVLYRAGSTGYRLALVIPVSPDQLAPFVLPLTTSQQPIPCLTVSKPLTDLACSACRSCFHRRGPGPRQRVVPPLRRALRVDHPRQVSDRLV